MISHLDVTLSISDIVKFVNCHTKILTPESHKIGISSITTDSRENADLFVALNGKNSDGHEFVKSFFDLSSSKAAIVDKNFELQTPKCLIKVTDTRKSLGDIARNYKKLFSIKTIGVTGSVGKTTIKDMINTILASQYYTLANLKNYNNDIGLPFTLFNLNRKDEIAILEMGMNNFGEIKYLSQICDLDIAIISNIGRAHIGRLGSKDNILKAKLEILSGLKRDGVLILNNDDELLSQVELKEKISNRLKIIRFGIKSQNCDIYPEDIQYLKDNVTNFNIKFRDNEYINISINGIGEHFVYNTLAAVCVAKIYNISNLNIKSSLEQYDSIRQKVYKLDKNITVIDDCYNASPDSVKNAICNTNLIHKSTGLIGRKIAVMGSMLELGEFTQSEHEKVAELLYNFGFDCLFSVGVECVYLHERAKKLGLNSYNFDNHETLIEKLEEIIKENDTILVKGSHSTNMNIVVEKLIHNKKSTYS